MLIIHRALEEGSGVPYHQRDTLIPNMHTAPME